MTAVTFQEEPLEPAFHEARALFEAHYAEIAEMKDLNRLDPNLDEYRRLAAMGVLHVLTARHDGRLVGYYACFIKPNLHYRSVVVGTDDLYFIHPDYRNGGTGMRLFLAAEEMQRRHGAMLVVLKEKIAHTHDALWTRLGYAPVERVFWKRLGAQSVAQALEVAPEGAC